MCSYPLMPFVGPCEATLQLCFAYETHSQELVVQAVEQSERPWLILLTGMSALSAVLLALVFWRLHGF